MGGLGGGLSLGLSLVGLSLEGIKSVIKTNTISLFHLDDLVASKAYTIGRRNTWRDYVDLFFILKRLPLTELLAALSKKLPSLDQNLVLKALVSFDDVTLEPIDFIQGNEVTLDEIRESIIKNVKSLPLGIH